MTIETLKIQKIVDDASTKKQADTVFGTLFSELVKTNNVLLMDFSNIEHVSDEFIDALKEDINASKTTKKHIGFIQNSCDKELADKINLIFN